MEITISYKNVTYPNNHIIAKLSNLIYNNIKILKLISNIYILGENQKEKFLEEPDKYRAFLEQVIKSGIVSGHIRKEEANEFLELWFSISDENLGHVLEQLIAKLGPYNRNMCEYDKSMETKVFETNQENDFDVVFFDKKFSEGYNYGTNIKIKDYNEFHECKKNVCTFIPFKIDMRVKSNVKRKLDFIKNTYDLKKSGKYYIPTFYPIVYSQRDFLRDYSDGKFSFIEILSVDDLYLRYSS
ncbi:hypothetical protein [Clostridium perfringens]|uniref:Uncharacterized protein n=1 Tax=Clostridium perfringens TaxID=1502 RepID=A0AAE8FRL0_CLOPF|nr:hypothetical protein [Clostridium perfringens]MDK2999578.1 hypothetical protein [Clostridium perfringens]RQN24200.1 hypothetical protein EHZ11_09365 [Clostridium perfringens]